MEEPIRARARHGKNLERGTLFPTRPQDATEADREAAMREPILVFAPTPGVPKSLFADLKVVVLNEDVASIRAGNPPVK